MSTVMWPLAVAGFVLVVIGIVAWCVTHGEKSRELDAVLDYLPPAEDPVRAAVSAMSPQEIRRECEQIILASRPWSVRYRRFERRHLPSGEPYDIERDGGL